MRLHVLLYVNIIYYVLTCPKHFKHIKQIIEQGINELTLCKNNYNSVITIKMLTLVKFSLCVSSCNFHGWNAFFQIHYSRKQAVFTNPQPGALET